MRHNNPIIRFVRWLAPKMDDWSDDLREWSYKHTTRKPYTGPTEDENGIPFQVAEGLRLLSVNENPFSLLVNRMRAQNPTIKWIDDTMEESDARP